MGRNLRLICAAAIAKAKVDYSIRLSDQQLVRRSRQARQENFPARPWLSIARQVAGIQAPGIHPERWRRWPRTRTLFYCTLQRPWSRESHLEPHRSEYFSQKFLNHVGHSQDNFESCSPAIIIPRPSEGFSCSHRGNKARFGAFGWQGKASVLSRRHP